MLAHGNCWGCLLFILNKSFQISLQRHTEMLLKHKKKKSMWDSSSLRKNDWPLVYYSVLQGATQKNYKMPEELSVDVPSFPYFGNWNLFSSFLFYPWYPTSIANAKFRQWLYLSLIVSSIHNFITLNGSKTNIILSIEIHILISNNWKILL